MATQTQTIDYKAQYEKMVAQRQKYTQRRTARINLLLKKAANANIRVTDAEVDAALKAQK